MEGVPQPYLGDLWSPWLLTTYPYKGIYQVAGQRPPGEVQHLDQATFVFIHEHFCIHFDAWTKKKSYHEDVGVKIFSYCLGTGNLLGVCWVPAWCTRWVLPSEMEMKDNSRVTRVLCHTEPYLHSPKSRPPGISSFTYRNPILILFGGGHLHWRG